ncbi:hypothetical protein POV27_02645 [Aureisphaera galaxeae]|uniref:hypothetical protein n=1 Tax=Aureisphaera galaxeae TaxID=1538023 RepID=UPI00234FED7C|nr:hypothetical protein [Aureisphaera galaxeae]MDC8002930.1 hypothetical protein [Aureisphaera galaxeae]
MDTPVKDQFEKWHLSPQLVKITETSEKIFSYASSFYSAIDTFKTLGVMLGFFEEEDPIGKMNALIAKISQQIEDIRIKLIEIEQHVIATSLLEIRRDLDSFNGQANSNTISALAYLSEKKRVGLENMDAQISSSFFDAQKSSLDIVSKIVEPSHWQLAFGTYKVYKDMWNGEVKPKANDGVVWDYRLALPVYLNVLVSRYIVFIASSESYQMEHKGFMKNHVRFLFNNVYKKIVRSIVTAKVPEFDQMKYLIPLMEDKNFFYMYFPNPKHTKVDSHFRAIHGWGIEFILEKFVPAGKWRRENYLYGAIEAYTGSRLIEEYPIEDFDKIKPLFKIPEVTSKHIWNGHSWWWHKWKGIFDSQPIPKAVHEWYDRFRVKFFLLNEKQKKELYVKLGLVKLHKQLRQMYSTFDMKLPIELETEYTGLAIKKTFSDYCRTTGQTTNKNSTVSLKEIAYNLGHPKSILSVEIPVSIKNALSIGWKPV